LIKEKSSAQTRKRIPENPKGDFMKPTELVNPGMRRRKLLTWLQPPSLHLAHREQPVRKLTTPTNP
jgi:hypothetical protein